MPLREDEPVVRGALRLVEVVAEVAVDEDRHEVGGGHRGRRVAGLRGRAHADRVDPELLPQLLLRAASDMRAILRRGFPRPSRGNVGACRSSRLHELSEHGVSVWMDSLSREMLETGELARLMEEDAVVGVTSNPTIFEKALSTGDWYDDQLREALERHDDPKEIFLELAVEDVRAPATSCDRSGSAPAASTATSRSRSIPTSRTTATRRTTRRCGSTSSSTGRTRT